MRWVQLCRSLNALWHCLSLGLEWKLTFASFMATAESRSPQWRRGSTVPCCRVRGTECSGAGISPLEGGHCYCHYPHHSLASGQTTGRKHSPAHQQEIGFKIYWAMASPIRTRPRFPHSQSLPSGSFHKPLTEWKSQSQKIKQTDPHGSLLLLLLSHFSRVWLCPTP